MMMISVVVLLSAYVLGSVSGSLLLGRLRGVDIRMQGSGNAGGTNALRTQGWKFALGTVLIDLGKGLLAVWLAQVVFVPAPAGLPYAALFAAILGHVWPLFHGFRGGKGAGTLVGGLILLWPFALLPVLSVWLLCLGLSGFVGLATVLAALSLPLTALATAADSPRLPFAVATALLIAYTHRGNLARLRAGNENRFEKARVLHRLLARKSA